MDQVCPNSGQASTKRGTLIGADLDADERCLALPSSVDQREISVPQRAIPFSTRSTL